MDRSVKLGLALSGGGFRATLFHLGVVRYLCHSGLLSKVRHITAVSGGSILAAHMACHWSSYLDPKKFGRVAAKLVRFARYDVRGRILRRLPTHFLVPYLRHESLLQWPPRFRRFGTMRGALFERYLAQRLYGQATLAGVAERETDAPVIEILATNLNHGAQCSFVAGKIVPNHGDGKCFPVDFSCARAVAISAAFPGFFPTTEIDQDALFTDPGSFEKAYLADGGIYDNLGLRRFQGLLDSGEVELDHVLTCDASGHFGVLVERETLGPLKTAWRSSEILMKRLADMERESAGLDESGEAPGRYVHLPIDDQVEPMPDEELLPLVAQQQLKNIRTDLDRFEDEAIDALQWHGYHVAARRLQALVEDPPETHWKPKGKRLDRADQVLTARLRKARLRKLRLFSARDWISYVQVAVLLAGLTFIGLYLSRSFQLRAFQSYVERLPKDSFGMTKVREIIDPNQGKEPPDQGKELPDQGKELVEKMEAAARRWPTKAQTQILAARTGYALLNYDHKDPSERDRIQGQGRLLMGKAVAALQVLYPTRLDQRQQDLFFQLRGHWHLAEGERFKDQGHPEQARRSWQAAFESYREQRRVVFHGLYGSEFNLCNAAALIDRLDEALDHCEAAHRLARAEGLTFFWQPKFNRGDILYRNGRPAEAAQSYLEALDLAKQGGEADRLPHFLMKNHSSQVPRLCQEPPFRAAFAELCASPAPR